MAIPPETHFFNVPFVRYLQRRATFPLDGGEVREALDFYQAERAVQRAAMPAARGVDTAEEVRPDPDRVLTPGARIHSIIDLFERFVEALVPPVPIVGEKTPFHLRWACRLLAERPDWRTIVVVRDPRGVVSSHLRAPFRSPPVELLALRWRLDQEDARRLVETHPRRTLVVRYESLVEHPAESKREMQEFCGAETNGPMRQPEQHLFHSWETWKGAALGPVLQERAGAWRHELSAVDVARVEGIVGSELTRHGYQAVSSRRPVVHPVVVARLGKLFAKRCRLRRFVAHARI